MEIIPINDSKLKIMLDERDMKEYNIGEEADCASNETRHAIRNILDRAKAQIGFDTEGSEIFVQLYTSKTGGCELFVTKGSSKPQAERGIDQKSDKKAKRHNDPQKCGATDKGHALSVRGDTLPRTQRIRADRMIFSFDSIKELCRACKVLYLRNIGLLSHFYYGENSECYLVLENTGISAYSHLDKLTFILEFATREKEEHISTYLSERCRLICKDNAVELLSKF